MIARATAEYTTDHAAEITETHQVAMTQLEGDIHMDEVNTGECSTVRDIYGEGTDWSIR
jgi:DNA topoisomerase VI subunit A